MQDRHACLSILFYFPCGEPGGSEQLSTSQIPTSHGSRVGLPGVGVCRLLLFAACSRAGPLRPIAYRPRYHGCTPGGDRPKRSYTSEHGRAGGLPLRPLALAVVPQLFGLVMEGRDPVARLKDSGLTLGVAVPLPASSDASERLRAESVFRSLLGSGGGLQEGRVSKAGSKSGC